MYQVEWIVENRVVLMRWIGNQTMQTVEEGVNRLQAFLDKGTPPVHVISDSRYLGRFPASLDALKKVMKQHKNSGQTVSIGGNAATRFVSMMTTRLSGGVRLEFRDTFEDALVFLRRMDTTLPNEIDYQDRPPDAQ
jgi:hypothetical protein